MDTLFSCFLLSLVLILLLPFSFSYNKVCYKDDNECLEKPFERYLFYDVNPAEGFNLRRDVYIRFAVLAHQMQKSGHPSLNFNLVLPPWSHLLHWNYSQEPEHIPWGLYFDIESLRMFAPVIEMHEFFSRYPKKYSTVFIDEVYTLQHFEDMFETGNFADRMKEENCRDKHDLSFFYYDNITSHHIKCLSYHGPATKLTELLKSSDAETILINHGEVALHEYFGSQTYWQARRSMRFSKELRAIADEFRRTFLSIYEENEEDEDTRLPENWQDEKPKRTTMGGDYVSVHLRRRDFARSRLHEIPSIDSVAKQIVDILKLFKLHTVFVATDAPDEEFDVLADRLFQYDVIKYIPPKYIQEKYKDGGVAIIDQILCSYARYFIGTKESTFTYRIQEEREILGFPIVSTFSTFCMDENGCHEHPAWTIVY